MNSDLTLEILTAMSPFEAWEMFVGNQPVREFLSFTPELSVYDSVESYVKASPLCEDLGNEIQELLILKFVDYIKEATE